MDNTEISNYDRAFILELSEVSGLPRFLVHDTGSNADRARLLRSASYKFNQSDRRIWSRTAVLLRRALIPDSPGSPVCVLAALRLGGYFVCLQSGALDGGPCQALPAGFRLESHGCSLRLDYRYRFAVPALPLVRPRQNGT